MQDLNKPQKGFTLIELLLSIALITALAGLSLSVFRRTQTTNDLRLATDAIVNSTRRARSLALLASEDDNWGIRVNSGEVVVFKGNDYSSRDTSYDIITPISPTISSSPSTIEMYFNKTTGTPSASGSSTFTNVSNNSVIITTNNKGVVSY